MSLITLPPFGSGKNKIPYQIILKDRKVVDLTVFADSLGASEEYLDSPKFFRDLLAWNPSVAKVTMFSRVVIDHNWAAVWRESLDIPDTFKRGMSELKAGVMVDLDTVIIDSMKEPT